jgi:hypothetical protein
MLQSEMYAGKTANVKPKNPRWRAFKIDFLVFRTRAASRFSSAFVLPRSPKRFSGNLGKSAPSRAFGKKARQKRAPAPVFGGGGMRNGNEWEPWEIWEAWELWDAWRLRRDA